MNRIMRRIPLMISGMQRIRHQKLPPNFYNLQNLQNSRHLRIERAIGQPRHETHPHIVGRGELTPGLAAVEFAERRRRIAAAMGPGAVAVVPGYGLRYVSNGIFYPFHQATNMLYLTGFNEPDCGCTIESLDQSGDHHNFSMFVQPTDSHTEIWDGPRAGIDGACTHFGADAAFDVGSFEQQIRILNQSGSIKTIYSDLPLTTRYAHSLLDDTHIRTGSQSATTTAAVDPNVSLKFAQYKSRPILSTASASKSTGSTTPAVIVSARDFVRDWVRRGNKTAVKPLRPILDQLRVIKSASEIRIMSEASRISSIAFIEAMRASRPGATESQIAAVLEFQSRMHGASGLAYVPVVASGTNANIIHYVLNQQVLRDGELLLVDAGAEYAGYASDITRTWPVNGKFTDPQRQLYNLVLDVQQHIIRKCVATNNISLNDLQDETHDMLSDRLSTLFGRQLTRHDMDIVYPHHVGHWLGLDVHDTSTVSRSTKLTANHVITIEPGIYIPNSPAFPEPFRGIGIRIEDDVVVGGGDSHHAPLVLTSGTPKLVDDIEAVMAGIQ